MYCAGQAFTRAGASPHCSSRGAPCRRSRPTATPSRPTEALRGGRARPAEEAVVLDRGLTAHAGEQADDYIPSASRRGAVVDPGLEALDVLGWPGLVARHAALGDPLVDGLLMLAHLVVGGEVEGERHRLDVGVAEEGADVPREHRSVLWHAQTVTLAPQRAPTASAEAAAAVAVSRAYVVRARSRTMPPATSVPSSTRKVIWSPRAEPGEITGCVPIGACLGAMPAIRS